MMTIEQAQSRVGREVIYSTSYGETERGVIHHTTDRWAFVRYTGYRLLQPTDPHTLTLLPAGAA